MAWELYKRGKVIAEHSTITVSRLGRLTFNKAAVAELKTAEARTLDLLWDANNLRFAVRVAEGLAGAFPMKHPKDNPNALSVSCIAFLNMIHYDWSTTRVFPAFWDSDVRMMIVEVPPEHIGTTAPIKRSAQRAKSDGPSKKPAVAGS